MMTTDTGGPGPDYGAGTFVDVFDNAISSAARAFTQYNAQAATPAPGAAAAAVGQSIIVPVAIIAGIVILVIALN